MFPWERSIPIEKRPTLNDDEGMFRGHENPEDLSGKLTMEDAAALDKQNQRHMDAFLDSIESLSHSQK